MMTFDRAACGNTIVPRSFNPLRYANSPSPFSYSDCRNAAVAASIGSPAIAIAGGAAAL